MSIPCSSPSLPSSPCQPVSTHRTLRFRQVRLNRTGRERTVEHKHVKLAVTCRQTKRRRPPTHHARFSSDAALLASFPFLDGALGGGGTLEEGKEGCSVLVWPSAVGRDLTTAGGADEEDGGDWGGRGGNAEGIAWWPPPILSLDMSPRCELLLLGEREKGCWSDDGRGCRARGRSDCSRGLSSLAVGRRAVSGEGWVEREKADGGGSRDAFRGRRGRGKAWRG